MPKHGNVPLGAAAALAAAGLAAVGVYGYDQVQKRLPRYRRQKSLFAEVRASVAPRAGAPRVWGPWGPRNWAYVGP
jgi:hypothetical protein